ncbi:MAG: hypothetical protein AAF636_11110 [Pseudomonadota bacterium]
MAAGDGQRQAAPWGDYFGAGTGSVSASLDEGAGWEEIARHLPTTLSVEVLEYR